MIELLTTTAIGLIGYHHAVYPLILRVAEKLAKTPESGRCPSEEDLPHMTVLIPAHNEAAVIESKVRNVCDLDYPADKLSVIVACDGCTDDTADIAQRTADSIGASSRVKVAVINENIGKIAVLNSFLPAIDKGIVALSDASAEINASALRRAAAWFADGTVGVVAGTYELAVAGSEGEDTYWKYQRAVKRGEAAMGAPLGVHGALYFIRAGQFRELPVDTINDDFIIPMSIVKDGYRAIYDTSIVAIEREVSTLTVDAKRRRRIAAGNFQQMVRMPGLLNPALGGIAFAFASGKALRALMPLLLLIAIAGCGTLAADHAGWAVLFAAMLFGIVLAVIRHNAPRVKMPKIIDVGYYIALGHFNIAIGTFRYVLGLDHGAWRRANA